MSAISNLIRDLRDVDKRIEEEETRHKAIVRRYESKLTELQRLSQILKGEIPDSEVTEKETPWLYLYKNNFIDAIEKALKNPEKK
jgi:hypothetical protein